jgi:hypothetical protein
VPFYDALHEGKAETNPVVLGGDERLEQAPGDVRVHARAGVLNSCKWRRRSTPPRR